MKEHTYNTNGQLFKNFDKPLGGIRGERFHFGRTFVNSLKLKIVCDCLSF